MVFDRMPTDDEFARMRLHPAYTETILAGIPAFA
jgi:HD-GYP domain-containing protein (c-di-GMP phosphodiesterase class II)